MKTGFHFGPTLLLHLFLITSARATSTFTCDGGKQLPVTSLCDDVSDCLDGTDEDYHGKGFKCNINGNNRRCVLPQELLNDRGSTYCDDLSDRCFNDDGQLIGSNCFRCLNGAPVVSVTQVCDGVVDCPDLSDECACQNNLPNVSRAHEGNPICANLCNATEQSLNQQEQEACGRCSIGQVLCSKEDMGESTCIEAEQVCDGVRDCEDGLDEMYCTRDVKCRDNITTATACDDVITCHDFSDECDSDCWHDVTPCHYVTDGRFACDAPDNSSMTIDVRQVCDGVLDCDDKADEKRCSSSHHFYCWRGDVLFANWSQRFDGVRHCEFGSDECPAVFHHTLKTTYANSDQLLRNPFLRAFVWVLVFPSLLGNIVVASVTARELWKDRKVEKLGRLAKCNRTFVLNLAFADLLMGIYLLMLGIENHLKSNRYCVEDRTFRSSQTCIMMGISTQVSAQTSVFLLILMTSYRLYGTLQPFRVEESRLIGGAASLALLSWAVSIFIAVMPQARSLYDYFVVSYWLPLPFLSHDILERSQMEKTVLQIYTLTRNNTNVPPLPNLKWSSMIDFIRQLRLATRHPEWEHQYVVPIGFYNQYPMCQPFFYPHVGDTAWEYMTFIIIFNFLAFVYIAVAYVIIYRTSSKPSVRKSVRRRSRQWRRDNRTMQKKIMCLVLTDMACWLPICVIFTLQIRGVFVHPMVHGITGAVILPINSAVNPLIYSNAITSLHDMFKRKLGYVESSFSETADLNRFAARSSFDTNGSLKSITAATSQGNLLYTDSPNNNTRRCPSAAMQKKLLKGFVRPSVSFLNQNDEPLGAPKCDMMKEDNDALTEDKRRTNLTCLNNPELCNLSEMKETVL